LQSESFRKGENRTEKSRTVVCRKNENHEQK
jgi:hypothetical protein